MNHPSTVAELQAAIDAAAKRKRTSSKKAKHGASFQATVETILNATGCWWVRTNQPYRIIGTATKNGQPHPIITFTGDGPPDYMILFQGRSVVADAKSTDANRWAFSLLDAHQADDLDKAEANGGIGALFIRLHETPWCIPWAAIQGDWRRWQCGGAARGEASLSVDDLAKDGWKMEGEWLKRLIQ
jgi:penicillin-binding protein-related factor A (putative recombinase)